MLTSNVTMMVMTLPSISMHVWHMVVMKVFLLATTARTDHGVAKNGATILFFFLPVPIAALRPSRSKT
jgi:hypothetical protein